MYTVYILHSIALDKFYIGFTGEPVELRLARHLANHGGFTGRAKDWKVVYTERFTEKTAAMKREKTLKNWKSKARIKSLVDKSSTE